jgi:hypothetical protein
MPILSTPVSSRLQIVADSSLRWTCPELMVLLLSDCQPAGERKRRSPRTSPPLSTAPQFRLCSGQAFMPDALTSRSTVESRHVTKSIAPEGGSYSKAATQAPPRNPAPQFRLFVGEATSTGSGQAFTPDALTSRSAVESRHVTKSIAPEGGSYNKAATQAPPRNPAPQFRLFVGEAFMPDALTSRSAVESRHVTKSIAPEGGSYSKAATHAPPGNPAPQFRLFVGEAFMPDAFRTSCRRASPLKGAPTTERQSGTHQRI